MEHALHLIALLATGPSAQPDVLVSSLFSALVITAVPTTTIMRVALRAVLRSWAHGGRVGSAPMTRDGASSGDRRPGRRRA